MKKNVIINNLTLNKNVISILDDSPMMYVVDTNGGVGKMVDDSGGGKSSKKGGCRYSRKHPTQCQYNDSTTIVDSQTNRC